MSKLIPPFSHPSPTHQLSLHLPAQQQQPQPHNLTSSSLPPASQLPVGLSKSLSNNSSIDYNSNCDIVAGKNSTFNGGNHHIGNGTLNGPNHNNIEKTAANHSGSQKSRPQVHPPTQHHPTLIQPNTSESDTNDSESCRPDRTDIHFRIGEKLEACDSTGTWYPAKIVAIDEPKHQVLIHFIRWSTRFDQWMRMDTDQLRALPKLMAGGDANSNGGGCNQFQIGDNVLAIWTDNKKYPGQILAILSDGNYNILFYDGYRKKVRRNLVEPLPADYDVTAFARTSLKSTPVDASIPTELKSNNSVITTPISTTPTTTNNTPIIQIPVEVSIDQPTLTPVDISAGKPGRKKGSVVINPVVPPSITLPVASKEFVVEEDHNQYKCTINGCNKSFRKETLLNSHIKHYHPEHVQIPAKVANTTNTTTSGIRSEPREAANQRRKSNQTSKQNSEESEKVFVAVSKNEVSKEKANVSTEQTNGIVKSSSKSTKSKINEAVVDSVAAFSGKENDESVDDGVSSVKSVKSITDSRQSFGSSNGTPTTTPVAATTATKKKRKPPPSSSSNTSRTSTTPKNESLNQLSSPKISLKDFPHIVNRKASNSHSASHIADWSDSTVEDGTGSSDGKSVRKKRLSQRRSTASKPSPGNASRSTFNDHLVASSGHFDLDDDCFDSTDDSRANSPKKKKRFRRNDVDINKQILNLKIDLQERRDANPSEFQDEPFLSNTPSTSSASESALAESADFGDFHGYDDKRYCDYSPLNDSNDRKKKKPAKPSLASIKKSKPDYSTSGSPLPGTPLSTILAAPFRRHLSLRSDLFSTGGTHDSNGCPSAMSPLTISQPLVERPSVVVGSHQLPFWDARQVKEIHESDEVDELVHCICDYKEESGLMIQCEVCLTWQHGTCFDIEEEEQVADCYVCFACRDPRMGRGSQRYLYDQEWLNKGKLPSLLCTKAKSLSDEQRYERVQSECSQKQMCSTNQLLGILVEITLVLKSLRHKLNLFKENRLDELNDWKMTVPREELMISETVSHTVPPFSVQDEDVCVGDQWKTSRRQIEPPEVEVHNGENEMIGDILGLSKNILETVPCNTQLKQEDEMVDVDLLKNNDDLDDATDLIDFITSVGKDSEKAELALRGGDIKKELVDEGLAFDDQRPLDSMGANETMMESKEMMMMIPSSKKPLPPPLPPRTKTVDELMLEHIVRVQRDLSYKLTLVEKKVFEMDLEMGYDKCSEHDLEDNLLFFKDTIKGINKDLDLVKELTEHHFAFSNHL